MKRQTSPVTGRCPVPNLNKTSRTVPALFLAAMRMAARNKRVARISGFFAALMMTLQSVMASYTVTLEGSGSYNPVGIHLDNPAGNDLNTLFPGANDNDIILLWDCITQDFDATVPTYFAGMGQWIPNVTLTPGQGVLYVNQGATRSVTLNGNPVTPVLPPAQYCGCDKKSMLANQSATVATWGSLMGAPPINGSQFITFDVMFFDWVTNKYENCAWTLGEPSAAIGEAVWVVVPCTNSVPCPCTAPPSGMTGWWTFDETSGSIANDIAGTVNNVGTYFGSPVQSAGMVAGALTFNGVTDFVLVTNHSEIDFSGDCNNTNAESLTIDAWIRVATNAPGGVTTFLDKRENINSTPRGYSMFLFNGKLSCQVADGTHANYASTSPDLRDGNWHFIAWTLQRCTNGQNLGTLYVDGAVVKTFTDTHTGSMANTSDLYIGRHTLGDDGLQGSLDELEIFKRVLSPSELLAIYNAGPAGKCKTPTVSTNCCDDCVAPYPVCYTNTIVPGYNYLADVLCHGTNNNLLNTLAGVVDGSQVFKWNVGSQTLDIVAYYDTGFGGWVDGGFNPIGYVSSSPGQGFVLFNPGATYSLIICGCEPECPPPCLTNTTGFVLVGRRGVGAAYWTNLSSCPPICGTVVDVWNGAGFDQYTYGPGGWSPSAPVVGIGRSVFVKIGTDTNCIPCTNNLVINGSFENPNIGTDTVTQLPTIPGWSATDGFSNGSTIEPWSGTFNGMTAQDGYQHVEINSATYDVTLSQVITNASTNCTARFCFWYTGRAGHTPNTFQAEVLGSGLAPVVLNPPAYTNTNTWLQYCVDFVPTNTTLVIRFTGMSGTVPAGAHIDNVTLMQCCTNTPCNEPLVVNCSTNKTVDCSAAWQFDAPTASSPCCGTNITISVMATWTNGFCPTIAKRIWQITDCLTNISTCTQTVTIVDITAPIIVCASNKTVECGTNWTFDAPFAYDECCSNVTVTLLSSNLVAIPFPCQYVYQGIWQAMDCCGNTNTCSQFVTVVDSTPPVFGTDCVTNTYFAGGNTSWVTPNAAFPRPALMARLQQLWGITSTRGFDECGFNQWFAHSFTNLPKCITAAYLEIRLKPCGDICDNDAMHLWFTGSANSNAVFSQYFGGGNPRAGLTTNDWCSYGNNPQTFILDLSALPASGGGVANVLPLLEANGFLDVTTQDDTGVDYVKLTVVSCCGNTSKTVECGSKWFFDTPKATDNCCTNPTVTVLNTVTNGVCPKIITRTWQAVDCCGNVATHSQSVTLVDTTPPVVNCPANMTRYTCSNSWVEFFKVTAADACSGVIPVTCNPPSGYNFPVGTTTVNCTATDACGNVGTCSFTVTVVSQSVETSVVLGKDDCFKKKKENAPKSAQLLALYPNANWKKFDSKKVNRPFGVSFMGLPKNLTCARLEIRMKANCKDISSNDAIHIGLTTTNTFAYSRYIGGGNPGQSLTTNVWCDVGDCGQVFTIDLSGILDVINAQNKLDIYVQDDTAVDYAKLTYCECRTRKGGLGNWWDLSNANLATAKDHLEIQPVLMTSNYSATATFGGVGGFRFSPGAANVGATPGASWSLISRTISSPTGSTITFTGETNGNVALALTQVRSGISHMRVSRSLNGSVVSSNNLPANPSPNSIIWMEDMWEVWCCMQDGVDAVVAPTEDKVTLHFAQPRLVRDCPMCPPTLTDEITIALVKSTPEPDDLLTSVTVAADGIPQFQIGDVATGNIHDDFEIVWISVLGETDATAAGDQITLSQPVPSTNRMELVIEVPLTNNLSFDLAAWQNIPGSSSNRSIQLFVPKPGIVGSVPMSNILTQGQDGVECIFAFSGNSGECDLALDFSVIGSSSQLYQVYHHGVQVASVVSSGPAHLSSLPGTVNLSDSGSTLIVIYDWAGDEAITINGTPHVGNELRVTALNPELPFGGFRWIGIGSSGQDGVSISAINTQPPYWLMLPLEDELEELSIEWIGPAGGALLSAPTVNGPWTIVPTQGGHSATAASPQATNAPPAQFFRVIGN